MTWPTFQCSGTAIRSRCIRRPAVSSRIGQRLLDRGAVVGLHRAEHRALVVLLEVLDQRDGVVGIELGGEIGDLLRLHLVDHVLADVLVEFGIDVGVDDSGQRLDQVGALVAGRQLDQVGDVGGVKLGHQRARGFVVAVGDRVEHFAHEFRTKPILLVVNPILLRNARLMRRGGDGVAVAHAPLPLAGLAVRGASLCPWAHWRNPARTPTWRPHFHSKDETMADADTLTFNLSTGGDVVIKLRPDLAPGHVERITEPGQGRFLRRRACSTA